jgi:stearoyl-CoA desaturase (delta-9 desaturase)
MQTREVAQQPPTIEAAMESAGAAINSAEAAIGSAIGSAIDTVRDAHVPKAKPGFWNRVVRYPLSWFDTGVRAKSQAKVAPADLDKIDWTRIIPFAALHLACFGVIWVGVSPIAVGMAVAMYLVRMFAITGIYHRYFSHKSYKTSRFVQFLFGVLGASAVQRGPIWWAAHHRHHHAFSDRPEDIHSPKQHGFWRSHMGWFLSHRGFAPDLKFVRDLTRFPELRFLDRFDIFVPVLMGVGMFFLGVVLEKTAPSLGTTGGQMLVWGFFISTIACYHGTYTINSLSHVFGRQRYRTGDTSRNNWFLALITLGEGWHNNHHYYPNSTRQGFYWYEIDITYYVLKTMSWVGLIWDLKPVPVEVRDHSPRRIRPVG